MGFWYQVKFTYIVQNEKGENQLTNATYLFEAVSYTDAEASATAFISSEFPDHNLEIKRIKFNEVFKTELDENFLWFKCRVKYIVFDEKSQKEKEVPFLFLLPAHELKDCVTELLTKLGTVQDYRITDISETKILGLVLPSEAS